MRSAVIVLLFCISIKGVSQYTSGINVESGLSNLRTTGEPSFGPDSIELAFNPGYSFGFYYLGDRMLKNKRSGFLFQAGLHQSRALFKNYTDLTPPRYEWNYFDLQMKFMVFNPNPEVRTKWYMAGGITGSYLFSAWRVYHSGADKISGEFNTMDVGLLIDLGVQRSLKRGDLVRLSLNTTMGFIQVFGGTLHSNGMEGKMLRSQLSVSYILGRKSSE